MPKPKVSVVTTLFNYKRYISECIESFINQDFKEAEHIIVDDASVDNSLPVVNSYIQRDSRISYVRLNKNMGYSYAKNMGIKLAKADILVMLDADDMVTENGISVRYAKLQEGYDFVHGPVLDLRDDGKKKRSKLWKQWMNSKKNKSCYRLVHAQTVMLKKDIHGKIGLYDESLRSKSDREMWARIFNHDFKIGWVDTDVSIYRRHPKQMHCSPEKLKINDKLQKRVLSLVEKRKKDLTGLELLE